MKRETLLLTLFAGISSLAVSMINPYIPLFAQDTGLGMKEIGYVVFTYYIVQVILRIPIGSLSDYIGDNRVILTGAISMLLSPIFYLSSLFFPPLIFVAQALLGIGHSVTWVTSPSLITKFRGPLHLYTFFMGLGWFLGPPIGGKLRDLFGMIPLFFALLFLSISSLVFAILLYSRIEVKKGRTKTKTILKRSFLSLLDAFKMLKRKEILIASYVSFIMFMSFGLGASLLPLYLAEIGFSSFLIGIITATRMGISTVIRLFSQSLLTSSRKIIILITCALLTGFSILLISFSVNIIFIVLLSTLWGLGVGLYLPIVFSIVAESTKEDERGIAMGLRGSMGSLGSAIGTLLFMSIADLFSLRISLAVSGISIILLSIPPIFKLRDSGER
jgi:ACDE family multidrug resistance protein